ncbi:histidine phosphatase family protein [Limnohabitans sp. Rim8]|uniref:SixA phosphatase family protein n=1 Tax=Limnohabitans sp. Rim8 TaxID=1100718 RepID=UPI002605772A|nr:histidine phosphatase family protein [Limnohabitans sp. Rim8]
MDLIFWRHAEAFEPLEGQDDLSRALTPRGEKQAKRMAEWLDRQLPEGVKVLVSPAQRTLQTAMALDRKYKVREELAPNAEPDQVLLAAGWPDAKMPILIVGHQPTLGQIIAALMGLSVQDCTVRKGAVWWLRSRLRDGVRQTVVVTVQNPDLL